MKKINLLAVMAALLIVIAIFITLFLFLGNKPDNKETTPEDLDLLSFSTVSDALNYVEEKGIEYSLESDSYVMGNQKILGTDAYMVEMTIDGDRILTTKAYFEVFFHIEESLSENGESVPGSSAYVFTENDKENIEKSFNSIKNALENKLSCSLDTYDLIPTREGVSISDDDDLFYSGLLVKEYSVLDRSGVLWLLRFDAAHGTANAVLFKICDDSNYEGFVPGVDLTKE